MDRGKESANPEISQFYNPERAAKIRAVSTVLATGKELIESHYNSDDRIKTASVRILEEHVGYMEQLAKVFALRADGEKEKALEAFEEFQAFIDSREIYTEPYFDHNLASVHLKRLLK